MLVLAFPPVASDGKTRPRMFTMRSRHALGDESPLPQEKWSMSYERFKRQSPAETVRTGHGESAWPRLFFRSLLGLLLTANPVAARTIYVSPSGQDDWSGQRSQPDADGTDGPVATLTRARDLIRQWKSSGDLDEAVRVVIADGVYEITEPLVLEPRDSGTKECPIRYESAPGARPIVSGGKTIEGFQPDRDGVWKVHLPEVAAGDWYFEQLFVDGQRAVRARTPNQFYDYMGATSEVPLEGEPARFKRTTVVSPKSLEPLEGLDPQQLGRVTLVAYHKWCISRRLLREIDTASSTMVTIGEQLKGYSPWPVNTRFHLENFKAALDRPGEWYVGREGVLYYMPLPGQDMTQATVVAPLSNKLLVLRGEPEAGRFVQHVTFQGLALRHNRNPLPDQGYAPYQAAFATGAAVMVDGARNVSIVDCEISHTGDYAVWFRRGCRDCLVQHSFLFDLAAGGVRIGEGQIRANMSERTSHITLDNNIIHRGGRVYTSAVGVWIGQSGDNAITHNDIGDFYYTGISAGWRWGYSDGLAKRNSIRFNHVHHLGQDVLSDMGGIYTLGPSEGTVVGNNVFHDIYSYSYGGWGLYTDEGSTGITMENNLVYNTKTGSFHQHYGKENVVRNNILALSELWQLQATRIEEHLSFRFHRNIVVWKTGSLLASNWAKVRMEMDNNCFFNASGEPITFAGMDLAAWRAKGHDENSIIADPLLVAPDKHDFRLQPGSPALAIGFEPFDTSQAGVYGEPSWKRKAAQADMPSRQIPPEPPTKAN